MSQIEERLKDLGLTLPKVGKAAGNYVGAVTTTGRLVFISGQGPIVDGEVVYKGVVGADLSPEEGYKAARITGLNLLAALEAEIGSLDRVKRIAKLLGWVACTPDFTGQPSVMNGMSDLFVEVFGDRGVHARSALSAHVLALGMAVEGEMVVEVE
ncbi:RidA family protein [Rhizobium sp. BR 315]|uniref:RidA family protein n=1 Tax=Rhizobium sp. BR 315 TaxID=3040014 RepID=UPI003D32983F